MDHRRIVNQVLATAAVLVTTGVAAADPPVDLADVAAGEGGFVINGIFAGDFAGSSVSGAGDVNGDGLPDVIVGAQRGASVAGESYVVFGKADGTAVDLADIVAGNGGFVMYRIHDEDGGHDVSGAGDVNGDGLADVIVGAAEADPGGRHGAGECYVVFGKADTTPVDLADIVAGNGGFVINGRLPYDNTGASVSDAGDVNGDGLADVVIGVNAPWAFVVFGKADGTPVELADVAEGTGGFVMMTGDQQIGPPPVFPASGAGDVNDDGLADVILGVSLANPGGKTFAGQSYVVFGKADGTPVWLADVAEGLGGGFVINGINAHDFSGESVSDAGDVNGDGLSDVIVGAPGYDNDAFAGESYVVFGKADTTPVDLADIVAGNGGFVMYGIDEGDRVGRVSGAGDANGDGLADVFVGARGADPAGECYVVFGKPDGAPVHLADVAAGLGGFVMNGIDAGDAAGGSVSDAGDVNGDGLPDVIVGARGGDPGDRANAGESYVVFGRPIICPADIDADGDVDFQDLLALLFAWGPCVGCPEDTDGDGVVGFADLLLLLFAWGSCESGACCFDDGACIEGGPTECLSAGGLYYGHGTRCAEAICPQPGACCLPDGTCITSSPGGGNCTVQGGSYQGNGSLCDDVLCPQPGACCLPDGSCVGSSPGGDDCAVQGGSYHGDGSLCAGVVCPQPGACCLLDGSCVQSSVGGGTCAALNGFYFGDDTLCVDVTCPPAGACCLPNGSCVDAFDVDCASWGGSHAGDATSCASVDCSQGACCLPSGSCLFAPQELCDDFGGDYQGNGIPCESVTCP